MPYGLDDYHFQLIVNTCAIFPEVQEVILYGSRADGTNTERSDIDLAVRSTDRYKTISSLKTVLEALPIINKFDVIDLDEVKDEGLLKMIKEQGKVVFQRE